MWANAQRDGALPNIGGALCSTPQSLADAHYFSALHNAANTRSRLKFAGVPQLANRSQALVGRSSPYYPEVHHIIRTCGGGIAV